MCSTFIHIFLGVEVAMNWVVSTFASMSLREFVHGTGGICVGFYLLPQRISVDWRERFQNKGFC
jgi:hypothetical protein